MRIRFEGASRQVTGSMFLLETEDELKILVDCGMDFEQRKKRDFPTLKQLFPFDPTELDLVILTHAHLDHCGQIPNLVKAGYDGPIWCTHGTFQLAGILLNNAAGLQRSIIDNYRRRLKRSRKRVRRMNTESLYVQQDVRTAMQQFVSFDLDSKQRISEQTELEFITAGHLLGAAHLVIRSTKDGQSNSIGFSGDIGRRNYPLLPDPKPMPQVDHLVCESTYGNRRHQDHRSAEEAIGSVIQRACVDLPGRLIIPAFSIGRTQCLLYTLNRLHLSGKLPRIRIFTDSPLARRSTEIHKEFVGELNQETRTFARTHPDLFDFPQLEFLENIRESAQLKDYSEPCIVISSSGMMDGGRIEQHIRHNLENTMATFLFIGYSAEGTFGHRLMNQKGSVMYKGREIPVLAQTERTDVFSGHADLDGLLDFIKQQDRSQLKNLFIVHGEETVMEDFELSLKDLDYSQTTLPGKGDSFAL